MNTRALLVIDRQRDFLASWQGDARDGLVTAVQELVALARENAWPVTWVREEMAPDLSDAPLDASMAGSRPFSAPR